MATQAKPGKSEGLLGPNDPVQFEVEKRKNEKVGKTLARATLDPQTRNASVAMVYGGAMFGDNYRPDLMQSSEALAEEITRAMAGDLSLASRVYASQAITLDAMFTELARRAAMNLGQYPQAVERFARLALKAQSNCRATLEALAKLHQPREQTVRHVHVNEGGQAIIAEEFHNHTGGGGNTIEANNPMQAERSKRKAGSLSTSDGVKLG